MRTLKPGGKAVISSWAPISDSPSMTAMFGALRAMMPDVPAPEEEVESLENPQFFEKELTDAGFTQVEIRPAYAVFPVESVDKFWRDTVKGSAPLAMMKKQMDPETWRAKEAIACEYLTRHLPDLPMTLNAKAWLGIGCKPT